MAMWFRKSAHRRARIQTGTTIIDILAQALYAVRGRRTRSWLTAAGIALGVAATVATIGLSSSAAEAISSRFDATRATLVTMEYTDPQARPPQTSVTALTQINGLTAGGFMCSATQDTRVTTVPGTTAPSSGERVRVHAAQPAALRALTATMIAGRMFDDGHDRRGDRVVLLDSVIANKLQVADLSHSPVIYLDGEVHSVVGVFQASRGDAHLTNAVVLPYEACRQGWADFASTQVVLRTALGAADQVGEAAPLALVPENPQSVKVRIPADLRTFRQGVEQDTQALFMGLAVISLIIGALGISNTTLVSVLERRAEIGLRRVVGARRRAIAGQFLAESAAFGIAGGVIGAIAGLDVTAGVCLVKGWMMALDPMLIAASPTLGLAVGILAGVYPAYAASRIAPASTLRG